MALKMSLLRYIRYIPRIRQVSFNGLRAFGILLRVPWEALLLKLFIFQIEYLLQKRTMCVIWLRTCFYRFLMKEVVFLGAGYRKSGHICIVQPRTLLFLAGKIRKCLTLWLDMVMVYLSVDVMLVTLEEMSKLFPWKDMASVSYRTPCPSFV